MPTTEAAVVGPVCMTDWNVDVKFHKVYSYIHMNARQSLTMAKLWTRLVFIWSRSYFMHRFVCLRACLLKLCTFVHV